MTINKNFKARFAAVCTIMMALCAQALFALESDPEDAIYVTPFTTFTDRNGNATNWVAGSYMVVNNYAAGGKDMWGSYSVRGLRWNISSGYYLFERTGAFSIGAAGMTFANNGAQAVFGNSSRTRRVTLTANQVWSGPATDGASAHVGFADDKHLTGSWIYQYAYMNAGDGVDSWTLNNRISVWFGTTNELANVDVRVEDPARIRLDSVARYGSATVPLDPCLNAKSLTLAGDAVMWQAGGTIRSYYDSQSNPTMQPRLDSFTIAPVLTLEGGADMLLKGATWNIPTLRVTGTGATSTLKGDLTFLRASTDVVLADGATLELAATNRESGVSAALAVSGVGTLRITPDVWELTGGLTLGNDVDLEVAGAGSISLSVSGGKSLAFNPGAGKELALTSSNIGYAGPVSIASGTVRLPSMAAFGETATFDIAADANVVFLSSAGFDASRLTGDGAANYTFDYLTVTDATVTEASITVYTNEVLRILGNGLTANTSVTLAGGTMRFERGGCVVASPISVTAGSFVEAIAEAVTGTVSGVVTCANVDPARTVAIPAKYGSATKSSGSVSGIWALGPGTVVFAGGGTFAGDSDRIYVTRDARVHLAGGNYSFGGTAVRAPPLALMPIQEALSPDVGWGRHLCIRDGANVTFSHGSGSYETKIQVVGPKDGTMHDATPYNPVLEIATGGTVTLPYNSKIVLGQIDNNVRLKITGGTLNISHRFSQLQIGSGQASSSAELYLESGTLSLGSMIQRSDGCDSSYVNRFSRFRFFWSGGTLKLNDQFADGYVFDMFSSLYNSSRWQANGVLRMSMQLTGTDCVLDLSEMQGSSVTNMPPVLDEAEWYGNGCLTVKGGKEFVMNSVPAGFSLKLEGEGTRVTIPEGAYVYDYASCLKYRNWNGNDNGNPYSVTNAALSALTMAGFTVAGTNCSLAVARDMPVNVTNVTVAASGDWNSRTSVSATGALTAENMLFEDGALLSIPYANAQTMLFPLTGTLSLPATVNFRTVSGPLSGTVGSEVFNAVGGISGAPVWNKLSGNVKVKVEGHSVRVIPVGMRIVFR